MLGAGLALVLGAPLALGDDVTERPKLENYSDYNQFLRDMESYRKHQHDQQDTPAAAGDASQTLERPGDGTMADVGPVTDADVTTASAEPAKPAYDPDSEDNPPPIAVNGPEDLDTAIEQAKSFRHPIYKVTKRFNRTTSQSFPLVQLDQRNLERAVVGGIWYSQDPLPDDRSALDDSTLQGQADSASKAKQHAQSKAANQAATDASNQQQAVDQLVRTLGAPAVIDQNDQQTPELVYNLRDVGHAAVIGIAVNSNQLSSQIVSGPQVLQVPNTIAHIR